MIDTKTHNPSISDALQVLFKFKGLILGVFFVSILSAIILSCVIKRTYKASSSIFVRVGRENLYIPILPFKETINPGINLNKERIINSEIQILKSRTLADEVVRAIGPESINEESKSKIRRSITKSGLTADADPDFEKAVFKLQKNITVNRVKDSSVIAVAFKHHDPQVAADAVNKLVDLYLYRRLAIHRNPKSYNFFKKQEKILNDKVKQAEGRYQTFKKENQISSLNEERSLLIRKISDLRTQLNKAMAREAGFQSRIIQLKQQMKSQPKTILREKEVGKNTLLISNLQTRLADLELKREKLRMHYTENSRTVKNIDEEIRLMRSHISAQASQRDAKSLYGANTTYQGLQEDLLRSEAQIKEMGAAGKVVQTQLRAYAKRLEDLNQVELDLNRHKQKLDEERQNYKFYLTKFEEARILNAMDKERITSVTLIDMAKPPIKPVSPNILLIFALAIALGVFGGITAAIVAAFLDNSLDQARDVEQYLGLPVLSTIPDNKALHHIKKRSSIRGGNHVL